MSVYKSARYSVLKIDDFITAPNTVVEQKILNRTLYMDYSDIIFDYNLPKKIMADSFYLIPSFSFPLVSGDRLQNIAFDQYGDSDYWWILAKYNKIVDPMDISGLTTIEIPMTTPLYSYLMDLIVGS